MDGGREDRPGRRTRTRVRFRSKPTVTYPLTCMTKATHNLLDSNISRAT
jgi:hypothetical protein